MTDLPYSLQNARVHIGEALNNLLDEKPVKAYTEVEEAYKLLTQYIQYLQSSKGATKHGMS